MTKDEALKMALEALEDIFGKNKVDVTVINVIKEALAQPEQEPVAWLHIPWDVARYLPMATTSSKREPVIYKESLPLYTHPEQREWVGITDAEIDSASQHYTENEGFQHGAYWAEAKLKEKNA